MPNENKKKETREQLAFDSEIYRQPVSNVNEVPPLPERKDNSGKVRTRRKTVKPLPDTLQPFLPGLSRRGRPRSKNPIPPSVRASESRKRRVEAGGKRIELLLEPKAAADLDALVDYYKVTRAELLSRLLAKAANSMRAKSDAGKP